MGNARPNVNLSRLAEPKVQKYSEAIEKIPAEVAQPIKTVDEPVVAQLKQAPVMAVKPTGDEVQVAEVVTRPPAQVEVAENTLPKTASPLPLIGLFGLLSLGAAFTLRAVASRVR